MLIFARRLACLLVLTIFCCHSLVARDWYIHASKGNDQNEGSEESPLATAQLAVNRAKEGDRIFLFPKNGIYRQSIRLGDGINDLIIVGNGVTLTGADPLPDEQSEAWEKLAENLYRIRLPATRLDRHLLIVDGVANRMGRLTSSKLDDYPAREELKTGEFRWERISDEEGWLVVKGPIKNLEWATRDNGLATAGSIRNVKVFQLHAKHFLNDGFNIHGDARSLEFYQISGYECFDEGFSAHDTCEAKVMDSQFYRNEHAIADVNAADTYYTNCKFSDSLAAEVLLQGGRHELQQCVITPSAKSLALSVGRGHLPKAPHLISPAKLTIRSVTIEKTNHSEPVVRFGGNTEIFLDSKAAKWKQASYDLQAHPDSRITNGFHHESVIGRSKDDTALKAWSINTRSHIRDESRRVIHLGRRDPAEFAVEAQTSSDWFGLSQSIPPGPYPPRGAAYLQPDQAAHALWRWIGMIAPDAIFLPRSIEGVQLAQALQEQYPSASGVVPVFLKGKTKSGEDAWLQQIVPAGKKASTEMIERQKRSPDEILQQLSQHYGQSFGGSYIDALALIIQNRLGHRESVQPLAMRYLEKEKPPFRSGSLIAGSLIFAELAGEHPEAQQRVIDVANMAFAPDGTALEAMPTHNEMSDAVFMSCPLLAKAGSLSGDPKYYEQCVRHFHYIKKLCLREDGLYRHSPLNEAAWGRGNGFPALGLVMALEDIPKDHPQFAELLGELQSHLNALRPWQNDSGMWHQVIDRAESYAEFTATCMISYSIARCIKNGWLLKSEWEPFVQRSWMGIKSRISTDGKTLTDVCTGTGKQKSLPDYFNRKAILGPDERGAAMAMLLAWEMKELF